MTPNMISCRLFSLVFVVFLALCSNPASVYAQFDPQHIRAVDATATGNNDGTSWTDAYVFLKDALDFASVPQNEITQIWVAAGTYRPDQDAANPNGTGDRDATFLLDFNNIQVLGGFLGDETDPDDRDPDLYVTVLSGILGTTAEIVCGDPGAGACNVANGSPGCDDGDCCSMVCAADPSCCQMEWDSACVDLAAITCDTCGDPDAGDCFDEIMGNGSPGCDIADCCALVCKIHQPCCTMEWDAFCGGLANLFCPPEPPPALPRTYHVVTADGVNSTVRLDGFTVTGGLATGVQNDNDFGGGMFIDDSDLAIVRCIFTGNSAPGHGGGAIHIQFASDPLIVNCQFVDNDAPEGGAIHSEFGAAAATLVNCLFIGNSATGDGGQHGGAIDHGITSRLMIVINCTFTDNTADMDGGAIYLHEGGEAIITNSILWNNSPDEIVESGFNLATVTYSDVQGGWPCPPGMPNCGNIGEDLILDDPLFIDPDGPDNDPDTFDDNNYRLDTDSPCIDVGDPEEDVIPDDIFDLNNNDDFLEPTPDLDLGDRVVDGDEISGADVDMGAYEFVPCPWDIDGDCVVGANDLLALLFTWGPCDDCDDCPADFDGTCAVGANDLLAMLFNWGPCYCAEAGTVVPSLENELADACLTQADWDEFEAVMTDPNSSQADKDRYNCWMTHYLFHCNKCTCEHRDHCPDPDPFS